MINRQFLNENNPEREDRINALIASTLIRNLDDLKVSLALIQSASVFALEGANRATASQIAERAGNDYGVEVTASFTGQTFSSLGIRTAISHGKSRFILEHEQLEDIRKGIAAKCEDTAEKLENILNEKR